MGVRRPRIFYGWWIVLIGGLGTFFGPSVTVFSFGIFFKPLVSEFHASRSAVSFAFTLHNVIGALWLPALGRLIDRYGARRVILPVTTIFAMVLLSALWMGHSILGFYVFYAALGLTLGGLSPMPFGVVIAHWFNRRRGFALGLLGVCSGFSAFVAPMMAGWLIAHFGWRAAYASFGGLILLVSIPIVAIFLQNDPADRGLCADGEGQPGITVKQVQEGMAWREIWHSRTFWLMLAAFSLSGASLHAGILHMPALLTDRGLSTGRAAMGSAVIGIALMVGRLASGYLMDRVFAPYVAMFFFGVPAAGLAILWSGQAGSAALIAAFLVGLGMGAEVEVMGYLMSRYFGLRSFATAYGHAFGAFMIAGALGTLLMGAGFDRFHSYTVPLGGFCVAMACAVVLLSRLGPYRYGIHVALYRPLEPAPLVGGA
jgi:MFS family permease